MATALLGIGDLIAEKPGVLGGRPHIAGARIAVSWVAHLAYEEGLSPEEMIREVFFGPVTLDQVHAALAFYHRNRARIDAQTAEDKSAYDAAAAASASLANR